MNPNQESEELDEIVDQGGTTETDSVDEFIRQLEEKEKDLHITAETTIIEIAEAFEGGELPDFIKGDFTFEPTATVPAAAPAPAKEKAPKSNKLEKEIADLKDQITALEAESKELRVASQRRAKDFENFKSRSERERKETFQAQIGNLATRMLPALDNLNRAVDFALALPNDDRENIQQFLDGIVLINQQVNDVFAEMGVQPIATVGHVFDPHYHEAVATEESEELEPNMISAELLRGYRIGDRVIRHSMVKVVTPSAVPQPPATEPTEDQGPATDLSDINEPEEV
jgi:molecular chaperone GrpE